MSKARPAKRSRPPTQRRRTATRARAAQVAVDISAPSGPKAESILVVGVGASAGGLEAFTEFLTHLPPDTGMAFVLIQHLSPNHQSLLPQALASATTMTLRVVEAPSVIAPNVVYVIPAHADVIILAGVLTLVPRPETGRAAHLPIDLFFTSLARDRGGRAIGVVLSGNGADGTSGLRSIKAEGGFTFAQEPATAAGPAMPSSAIDAGVVDQCATIADIARELVRLSHHSYVFGSESKRGGLSEPAVVEILRILRETVGVDFGEYKAPSLSRRLARRMAIRHADSPAAYLSLLKGSPEEAHLLYEDLLIHVTSFFRDPDVFARMQESVFPKLLAGRTNSSGLRLWVAGCATGQEVYSLGMALVESLGDRAIPIQIFGSDISEGAIAKARSGVYTDAELAGVSDERRARFFTRVDRGYRVATTLRERCVFVRHDLTRDPPFSKLDFICCRNVLIYFTPALQRRTLANFHYALGPSGLLLVGQSESLTGFDNYFAPFDAAARVFSRIGPAGTSRWLTGATPPRHPATEALSSPAARHPRPIDAVRYVDRVLLDRYAPPGVVVDTNMHVLQYRGQTGAYLQAAEGEPQTNLLLMAKPGLSVAIHDTVARAKTDQLPRRSAPLEVDEVDGTRLCCVVAVPIGGIPNAEDTSYVVLFEEVPTTPAPVANLPVRASRGDHESPESRRVERLEHELRSTRSFLQSVTQDHAQAIDALCTSNEELVSGNEELQSLNEELETAKEELQSINEELSTVNEELHTRNQEVTQINADLSNVLRTIDLPVVIVDLEHRIRRLHDRSSQILSALPGDIGRPLEDIRCNLALPELGTLIASVIDQNVESQREVQDRDGHWYRLRVQPYMTLEGKAEGAVLSLVDIHELKHHIADALGARADAERANRVKDEFLATLSHELRGPLSSMLLYAQLVRRGDMDADKMKRAGEAIELGIKMQVQLTDDLLDVSRIVAGKVKMHLQSVDLCKVVDAALEAVKEPAERKSTQLEVHLDRSMATVFGARARLQQVVTNLLLNAIKFTPNNGAVTVTLEAVGAKARLSVRDTGIGIEPAFLPHVFSRFTQGDSSLTRAHGGLGIGLAIVHHMVQLHGGSVRAESAGAGTGATFSVELPLMEVPTAPFESVRPGSLVNLFAGGERLGTYDEGHLGGLRILVVDDDPETRQAVSEILTQSGALVFLADSASQGIAALRGFRPDIIISDIAMPGEDGYAFIRRVRALTKAHGGRTPALALTALASDDDRRRALAEGYQMHLAKPVDLARLSLAAVELSRMLPIPKAPGLPTL